MENIFALGRIVMTKGIASWLESDSEFARFCYTAIGRYQKCDWGDLSQEDKEMNDEAVRTGESRILAAYIQPGTDITIWIITEWDRSATTILFPKEY